VTRRCGWLRTEVTIEDESGDSLVVFTDDPVVADAPERRSGRRPKQPPHLDDDKALGAK
jgi:hypothetical protein